MRRELCLGIVLAFAGFLLLPRADAQSDDPTSLGDLARSLRQEKQPAAPVVIDNDNLSQVMDAVESRRLSSSLLFSLDGPKNSFQVSSPDGTCSLSFSANATSLLSDPNAQEALPPSELTKLDGPAMLNGDTLQVSLFNGTDWDLKEITVGVTVVRPEESEAAFYRGAKLLPAVATTEDPNTNGKPSDKTLVLHLRAQANPLMTTIFREKLNASIAADQEWHWAIISAKGVPTTPQVPLPTF